MKVFTHGTMINFQASSREMTVCHLDQLIREQQRRGNPILFGTVDLHKEELQVYGHVQTCVLDEDQGVFHVQFYIVDKEMNERTNEQIGKQTDQDQSEVKHRLAEMWMSHDAAFDLLDERDTLIRYQVIYVTMVNPEDENELTYFFAEEGIVNDVLSCVVEFWKQVHEVGRDVDFSQVGCKAYCLHTS